MTNVERVYYSFRTHLEMLNDTMRCNAYRKALEKVVEDKVVLDIGCGSGILSFFAVRAGARRVIAVDTDLPPGIEEVARINGVANRITFLNGRIQDIELPVESVDVIVSEWMGGVLLMENMLPAVLYARDRWLKPDGLLLPDRARLFLVPLDDVAGINGDHLESLRQTISSQMWVSMISPSRFLANPFCILDLDLYRVQEPKTQSYQSAFRFYLEESGTFNGFGLWFDVAFTIAEPPVLLSTAPWLPLTHWAQALWILPSDIEVSSGDWIAGTFSQEKISPSSASFQASVGVKRNASIISSFTQRIEAAPSNMNSTNNSEEHIIRQSLSGFYKGKECLWIGCSMSFSPLTVAGNGAECVYILNHSQWAREAMMKLVQHQNLYNIDFIESIPAQAELERKDLCILGSVDSSWHALLSHIRVRTILKQAAFQLQFFMQENPWKEFYGFDFSEYARYDLEMFHDDGSFEHWCEGTTHFKDGFFLIDVTDSKKSSPVSGQITEANEVEIIYSGEWILNHSVSQQVPDGKYNYCLINFVCGMVVLPLPQVIHIHSQAGKLLEKIELIVRVLNRNTFNIGIKLDFAGGSFYRDYNQPLSSMGHIIRV